MTWLPWPARKIFANLPVLINDSGKVSSDKFPCQSVFSSLATGHTKEIPTGVISFSKLLLKGTATFLKSIAVESDSN